jgi:hypothetical protein
MRVIDCHENLPDESFAVDLPEGTVDLGKQAEDVIASAQDQGHRLSLFCCFRDSAGSLLVGLASHRSGNETVTIEDVSVKDAATGVGIVAQCDAHWSAWRAGEADEIRLWCFTPASPRALDLATVDVDVSAGIFESYRGRRVWGSRRVRNAQYAFQNIPVSESPWSVFPECASPPWVQGSVRVLGIEAR